MDELPSIKNFVRSFGAHWFEYMSGGPSVPLMLGALFIPNRALAVATGITGIVCGLFASYLVWASERRRVNDLLARATPKFTISFDPENKGIVDTDETRQVFHGMLINGKPMYRTEVKKCKYIRIAIEAISNMPINGCEAYIASLEKRMEGEWDFHSVQLPQHIPLQSEPFSVKYAVPHEIDFAKTDSESGLTPTPNVLWPNVLAHVFKDRATYRFTFRVHGGGITLAPMAVEIDWRGTWNEISARQIQPLSWGN